MNNTAYLIAFWPIDAQGMFAFYTARAQSVIDNPHIVDAYYCKRVRDMVHYFFYKIIRCRITFEYQNRGSIHCHGVYFLKYASKKTLEGYISSVQKDEFLEKNPNFMFDLKYDELVQLIIRGIEYKI